MQPLKVACKIEDKLCGKIQKVTHKENYMENTILSTTKYIHVCEISDVIAYCYIQCYQHLFFPWLGKLLLFQTTFSYLRDLLLPQIFNQIDLDSHDYPLSTASHRFSVCYVGLFLHIKIFLQIHLLPQTIMSISVINEFWIYYKILIIYNRDFLRLL